MKYQQTIGIIGGMGSYATLDIFHRILNAFPAEKEWDRPHIIIDNRCTMPSRVRAILYEEERSVLISELVKATRGLLHCKSDVLIYACNTCHVFLEEVFAEIPEAKEKTIHLIDTLARSMASHGVTNAFLLATEGTIESGIYQQHFNRFNIDLQIPDRKDYAQIRTIIEAVKHNQLNDEYIYIYIYNRFNTLCNEIPAQNIILGCTELPIIAKNYCGTKTLWDPLTSVIQHLQNNLH